MKAKKHTRGNRALTFVVSSALLAAGATPLVGCAGQEKEANEPSHSNEPPEEGDDMDKPEEAAGDEEEDTAAGADEGGDEGMADEGEGEATEGE